MRSNYQRLEQFYTCDEIQMLCVDKDFMFAFITAMASMKQEIELQQWFKLLCKNQSDPVFSSTQLAADFAEIVLAIFAQARQCFAKKILLPLTLTMSQWMDDKKQLKTSAIQFSLGYIQGLEYINTYVSDSDIDESTANLKQTCFLLLSKLAYSASEDLAVQSLFLELPKYDEILRCLPKLLTTYGAQCHES
ncbi:UPF0149 family protein [Psychromonas sp. CD1]|uniref:UPF0149 family protein n=1 Tax=Psychromonas sp. CD1 TaxID=1979839 RepID=UPI000B9A7800|nr:UPF0149 family protein [Psychromonas sp. CD1]